MAKEHTSQGKPGDSQQGTPYAAALAAAWEIGFFTRHPGPDVLIEAIAILSERLPEGLFAALMQVSVQWATSMSSFDEANQNWRRGEGKPRPHDDTSFHHQALIALANRAFRRGQPIDSWYWCGVHFGSIAENGDKETFVAKVTEDVRLAIANLSSGELDLPSVLNSLSGCLKNGFKSQLIVALQYRETKTPPLYVNDAKLGSVALCETVVRELRQAVIHPPHYRDERKRERDKWIHEQYFEDFSYGVIIRKLGQLIDKQTAHKWARIKSENGIKQCAKNYHAAYCHGELPKRAPGRPTGS